MEIDPRFVVVSDRLERPGINLQPLVYKTSDITTAPRRLYMEMEHRFIVLSDTGD